MGWLGLVEELEAIFGAGDDAPVAGLIRFMPITRLIECFRYRRHKNP